MWLLFGLPMLSLSLGLLGGLLVRESPFNLAGSKESMILDAVKLIERCCVTHRIALIGLFVAILPTLIPLCEVKVWNGLGPFPFGPVYSPENYSGPLPSSQITAESWGAASVVVPFQVRVKNYLTKENLVGFLFPGIFGRFSKIGFPSGLAGRNLMGQFIWIFRMLAHAFYSSSVFFMIKDLFDSAGVKYLFLDKAYFGPGLRNDDSVLASPAAHLSIAYQDSRVRISRSDEANSRFRLTSDFSFKEALAGTHPPIDNVDVQTPFDGGKTSGNLEVIEARPNSLKIEATTDVPQLLVTTDCYDPGWGVAYRREEGVASASQRQLYGNDHFICQPPCDRV
jgi:hypothetical protein